MSRVAISLAAVLVLVLPAAAAPPRVLPSQDAWPVWAPVGRSIAFTRIDSSGMTLELLRLGKPPVAIARNAYQLAPSWSPDATRIAYQAGGSVFVKTIGRRVVRLGTGGAPAYVRSLARVLDGRLVVNGVVWAKAVIGQPAWSPDGSKLAFALAAEIWVAGSGIVPAHAIARGMADASTPSWTFEGDGVVYSRRGAIEVTSLSGRSSPLVAANGLAAAFSPLQDVVAFAGPRPGCPGHVGISLWQAGGRVAPATGTCEVRGTPRADVIEGSPLWGDVILAGAGNDQVHANDGHTDRVDCGPGRDTVWADRSDRLSGCEIVHR